MANTNTRRTARLNTRTRSDILARLDTYAAVEGVSRAAAVERLLDVVLPPAPEDDAE